MNTEELTNIKSTAATTDTQASDSADSANLADNAQLSPAALSLLGAALLAACGGGGSGSGAGNATGVPVGSNPARPSTTPPGGNPSTPIINPGEGTPVVPAAAPPSAPGFNNSPSANTDAVAARFLQQAQFSSKPDEIAALRTGTYANWLQQQYAKPITQTGWDWLEERGYGNEAVSINYVDNPTIADYMLWNQLFTAPDQMRKRIALALSEFFVVSLQSTEIQWRGHAIAAYWDILNKFAFGNYRDLLEEVTLSAAMGNYLNTRGNQKEDLAKGRRPDENYAREVMQLFTIGLYQLNLDGTPKGTTKEFETYDADDVSQLARVFTGYDFDSDKYQNFFGIDPATPSYAGFRREYTRQRMRFYPDRHSTLAVSCLGINIPAGDGSRGPSAMKAALDGLFNHPNVGPFFAKQMIQRLVTSNPTNKYVERVASAFNNDGAGVRGNLKAVWAAILLDDEARIPNLANIAFGKVREPMVRFVQWGRTFNLRSLQNSWKIYDQSNSSYGLAQSPFRSPSVFNFFRPGYTPAGIGVPVAPEFQIINEVSVGGYINFMAGATRVGLYAFRPDKLDADFLGPVALDIVPDYSAELALIDNTVSSDAEAFRVTSALADRLNLILCAGQLSSVSLTVVKNALKAAMLQVETAKKITVTTDKEIKLNWIAAGVLMIMASSDYLVQK